MTLEYQVAALHADILYCDGKEWPEMFARMDTGLMAAQTGLAVHMGQLGLLLECTEAQCTEAAKKRRLRADGRPTVSRSRGMVLSNVTASFLM